MQPPDKPNGSESSMNAPAGDNSAQLQQALAAAAASNPQFAQMSAMFGHQQPSNVPLLVGATPLQQQLSALSGYGNAPAGQQPSAAAAFGMGSAPQPSFDNNSGGAPQDAMQQLFGANPGQAASVLQNSQFGGINLQQLQQLQFAQQLFAANNGLNPLGNLNGMPNLGGLGAGAGAFMNPQFAALAGAGGLQSALASNQTAQAAPSTATIAEQLGGGQQGGGAAPAAPKQDAMSPPASRVASKPSEFEWAEPFAGKGKKEPPFPLKLQQILSNPEFQEFICWNPHGRSWRILKPALFEQVVIPLYFRHAKYASFMRQVNGWGFKRIVSLLQIQ
jgi:hypothetical protein